MLTSPFCHEGVDIHEECQQLERDLEPWLFPERLENIIFEFKTLVTMSVLLGYHGDWLIRLTKILNCKRSQ